MIYQNHNSLDLRNVKSFNELEFLLTKNTGRIDFLFLELLPETITKPCATFQQNVERKAFVYSTIAALSSLMVNVSTEYGGKKVFPMIYFALIGPAGSNKGTIKYAAKLLQKVHLEYKHQSEELYKQYSIDYRKWTKAVKNNPELIEPKRPPYQSVLIAADITKSKLIQQLFDNKNIPTFMINDEIDTLLASSRGQYGAGISSILRTAYHHDLISQQLKSENQHYEIEEPKFALCLAGTPSQMISFIENIENGLYSRFTILQTEDSAKWNSVAPCPSCPNREETFDHYSAVVMEIFNSIRNRNIQVMFSDHQWEMINDFGESQMLKHVTIYNENMGSVVKRHGLMIVKMAMVFSVLRAYENGDFSNTINCDNESFIYAMVLAIESLHNSSEFFKLFPNGKQTEMAKNNKIILGLLPNTFTRSEAVNKAEEAGISIRTIDRSLFQMEQEGMLKKISHGVYKKSDLANWQTDNVVILPKINSNN